MNRHILATSLLLVLSAAIAGPAAGEIYRCVGPDGKTTYTSSESACPGAQRHVPKGGLQTVPGSGSRATGASRPPASRAPSAAAATAGEAAQAAEWRAKRRDAEAEQKRLAHNVEAYRRVVQGCNRGGNWWKQDETGLREEFDCDEARTAHEKAEKRLTELDHYLDGGGLAEDCRRAGCLPGWIR